MAIVPQTAVVDHHSSETIAALSPQLRDALAARVASARSYAPDLSNTPCDAFALLDAQVNQQIEGAAVMLKQSSDC